ncbi:zinc finger and SCAN domain-containing protein 12-like [Bradysia coprophila]|uniref:zinc finger and SCAN domain-containing protein 12-like n=1 Tax=Bradysia coprophila TaxID=38358 RepID=UPI00187D9E59|nr:zinc finger and SCAN domain-containing protein 12-like [Bradysia coprophila]
MSDDENDNIFSMICRLCLTQDLELISLYSSEESNTNSSNSKILEIIERFTTIKIHPLDNLPQKICTSCINTIQSMLAFQNKCKQNNVQLLKMTVNREECVILDDVKEEPPHLVESETSDGSENLLDESLGEMGNPDELQCPSPTESVDRDESEEHAKKILEVNVDDLESDDETGNFMKQCPSEKYANYPKWKPPMIACDVCGKLYGKYKLQHHMNKHNGLKPFECNEPNCTSKFSGPHYLSRHKRLCHSVKPLLYCDVCGRGFKVKAGLENHRSYHFDPKIPCKICQKLFRNKRALLNHMLVHSQDRKYKCETCGKAYQRNYTLRIHRRVHTQEKPYSCPCGVSFAYKCLLKSHTEKYHK